MNGDDRKQIVACVTGATGIVGSRIVKKLLHKGYRVRILSRASQPLALPIECFQGSIDDDTVLKEFISGASFVFHCAAELNDPSKMWKVNVEGTRKLIDLLSKEEARYFCHLSSAGVVGLTDRKVINENTDCHPVNEYERSKWEAEQRVTTGISNCSVVILRPTNVVDEEHPGVIGLPLKSSIADLFKVIVKGRECAHVVHADDVAAAALFFIDKPFDTPQCFFVSCDDDSLNTIRGLWKNCRSNIDQRPSNIFDHPITLPMWVPHIIRTLRGLKTNYGDVRYSSEKIRQFGFEYPLGLRNGVVNIVQYQIQKNACTEC